MENNNDKIVTAINEFKRSVGDTAISIHGKQYSLVATRLAVARRVLGSSSKPTRSGSSAVNESAQTDRWAKLAGIKSK